MKAKADQWRSAQQTTGNWQGCLWPGSAECRHSPSSMQANIGMETHPHTDGNKAQAQAGSGEHRPVMPMSSYCFTAPDGTVRNPSF